jgi:hypothetical protein
MSNDGYIIQNNQGISYNVTSDVTKCIIEFICQNYSRIYIRNLEIDHNKIPFLQLSEQQYLILNKLKRCMYV